MLSLLLLCAVRVQAQALVIHGHPQKTAYADASEWPFVDGQCHWVPGDGSPAIDPPNTLTHDMAHSHGGVQAPIWAELGAGPITVPITVRLFHTAGKMDIVMARLIGGNGQMDLHTVTLNAPVWPIPGDTSGLVTVTGTLTFNPQDGVSAGIVPLHGWFNVELFARTDYTTSDTLDLETILPFYSVIDRTAPERPLAEGGILLAAKCHLASARDAHQVFQAHITEFRNYLPILAPFNQPITTTVWAYNYGQDAGFPLGVYELRIDPDLHMGLPGTLVATTQLKGTAGNVDILDPAQIDASVPPMGFAPHHHRLSFTWDLHTGTGFLDQFGGQISAGEELKSLLNVTVTIGDGPAWPPDLAGDAEHPGEAPIVPPAPPPPPPPPPVGETFTTRCTVQFQTGTQGHTKTLSDCSTN